MPRAGCAEAAASCRSRRTNGGERRGRTRAPLREAALARSSFIEGLCRREFPTPLRDEALSLHSDC
jgi:hypothetical protein